MGEERPGFATGTVFELLRLECDIGLYEDLCAVELETRESTSSDRAVSLRVWWTHPFVKVDRPGIEASRKAQIW